jgi:hypothetical protein
MSTRYGGVSFVEMADIDSMARFSVAYVNIFGAHFGSRGGSHPRCPAKNVGHAQPPRGRGGGGKRVVGLQEIKCDSRRVIFPVWRPASAGLRGARNEHEVGSRFAGQGHVPYGARRGQSPAPPLAPLKTAERGEKPDQPFRHCHVPKPLRPYGKHVLRGLAIECHCQHNVLAQHAISTGGLP